MPSKIVFAPGGSVDPAQLHALLEQEHAEPVPADEGEIAALRKQNALLRTHIASLEKAQPGVSPQSDERVFARKAGHAAEAHAVSYSVKAEKPVMVKATQLPKPYSEERINARKPARVPVVTPVPIPVSVHHTRDEEYASTISIKHTVPKTAATVAVGTSPVLPEPLGDTLIDAQRIPRQAEAVSAIVTSKTEGHYATLHENTRTIAAIEEELAAHKQERDEVVAMLEKARREAEEAKQRVAVSVEYDEEARAELEALRAKLVKTRNDADISAKESAIAKAVVATVRQQLAEVEANVKRKDKDIATLEADTRRKEEAISALEETKAELEATVFATQKEKDGARQRIEAQLEDAKASLKTLELERQTEKEQAAQRILATSKEKRDLEAIAEDLRTQLRDAVGKRTRVVGELATYRKHLADASSRIVLLEKEGDSLKKQLQSKKTLEEEISKERMHVTTLTQTVKELNEKIASSEETSASQVDSLQTLLRKAEEEKNTVVNNLTEKEAELKQVQRIQSSHQEKIKEKEAQLERVRAEKGTIQAALSAAEKQAGDFSEQLKALEERNQGQAQTVADLRASLEAAKKEKEAAEEAARGAEWVLNVSKVASEEHRRQMAQDVQEANAELKEKEAAYDAVLEKLQESNTKAQETSAEINQLRADMKQREEDARTAKQKLDDTVRFNAQQHEELSKKDAQIKKLQDAITKLKAGNDQKETALRESKLSAEKELLAEQEQVNTLKQEIDVLQTDMNGLKDAAAENDASKEALEAMKKKVDEQVQELQREVDEKEAKMNSLSSAIKTSNTDYAKLSQRLSEKETAISTLQRQLEAVTLQAQASANAAGTWKYYAESELQQAQSEIVQLRGSLAGYEQMRAYISEGAAVTAGTLERLKQLKEQSDLVLETQETKRKQLREQEKQNAERMDENNRAMFSLRGEIQRQQDELEQASEQRGALESSVGTLKAELEEARKRIATLEKENGLYMRANADFQQQSKRQEALALERNTEIVNLREDVSDATEIIERNNAEIQQLRVNIGVALKAQAKAESDRDEAANERLTITTQLEAKIGILQQKLRELGVEQGRQVADDKQGELADLQRRLASTEASMQEQGQMLIDTRASLETTQQQLDEARKTNTKIKALLKARPSADAKGQLDINKAQTSEISVLRTEVSNLKRRSKVLQKEIDANQGNAQTINALQVQLNQAEEQASTDAERLQTLEKEAEASAAVRRTAERSAAELDKVRAMMAELTGDKDELMEAKVLTETQLKKLEAEFDEARRQLEETRELRETIPFQFQLNQFGIVDVTEYVRMPSATRVIDGEKRHSGSFPRSASGTYFAERGFPKYPLEAFTGIDDLDTPVRVLRQAIPETYLTQGKQVVFVHAQEGSPRPVQILCNQEYAGKNPDVDALFREEFRKMIDAKPNAVFIETKNPRKDLVSRAYFEELQVRYRIPIEAVKLEYVQMPKELFDKYVEVADDAALLQQDSSLVIEETDLRTRMPSRTETVVVNGGSRKTTRKLHFGSFPKSNAPYFQRLGYQGDSALRDFVSVFMGIDKELLTEISAEGLRLLMPRVFRKHTAGDRTLDERIYVVTAVEGLYDRLRNALESDGKSTEVGLRKSDRALAIAFMLIVGAMKETVAVPKNTEEWLNTVRHTLDNVFIQKDPPEAVYVPKSGPAVWDEQVVEKVINSIDAVMEGGTLKEPPEQTVGVSQADTDDDANMRVTRSGIRAAPKPAPTRSKRKDLASAQQVEMVKGFPKKKSSMEDESVLAPSTRQLLRKMDLENFLESAVKYVEKHKEDLLDMGKPYRNVYLLALEKEEEDKRMQKAIQERDLQRTKDRIAAYQENTAFGTSQKIERAIADLKKHEESLKQKLTFTNPLDAPPGVAAPAAPPAPLLPPIPSLQ